MPPRVAGCWDVWPGTRVLVIPMRAAVGETVKDQELMETRLWSAVGFRPISPA